MKEGEKQESKARYHTPSEVLRELVDRDSGFTIMLILEEKEKNKKLFQEFLINTFQLCFYKDGLKYIPFSKELLDEIQICQNPISAPSPEQREFLRHRSFFLFTEFTPSPGCSEVTVCFLLALPREELDFESVLHLVTRVTNRKKGATWSIFCTSTIPGLKASNRLKVLRLERKETKMTASSSNDTRELSGKFHFRATTKTLLSWEPSQEREQSSPHLSWAHCCTCESLLCPLIRIWLHAFVNENSSFNLTRQKLFLKAVWRSEGSSNIAGSEREWKKKKKTWGPSGSSQLLKFTKLLCRSAPERRSVNHKQKTSRNLFPPLRNEVSLVIQGKIPWAPLRRNTPLHHRLVYPPSKKKKKKKSFSNSGTENKF